MRRQRTGLVMVNGGQWVKVARRDYQHVSGARVVYRCNQWLWEVVGGPSDGLRYELLDAARYEVERVA